jgi:hypothetical protein
LDKWAEQVQSSPVIWKPLTALSLQKEGLEGSIEKGAVRVEAQLGDGLWQFRWSTSKLTGRVTAVRLVGKTEAEGAALRIYRFGVNQNSAQGPALKLKPHAGEDSLSAAMTLPLLEAENINPYHWNLSQTGSRSIVFALEQPLDSDSASSLVVTVNARANTDVTRWHLEVTDAPLEHLVAAEVRQVAALDAASRSSVQQEVLRQGYLATLAEVRVLDDQLLAIDRELHFIDLAYPASMVMEEMAKPRETFILERGEYDKPGEKVTAATPAVLPAMAADLPRNRLGLAKWLVSAENPLTARVVVNRFWQQLFGTGLVKTSEDFGAQGESPSHPELLDWLASEFIRSGWDVKQLMRLIVSSATYRQQSQLSLELLSKDPENRLLARGPRLRLPGELIRDQALTVSGLLVPTLGGPPLRPYHPAGMYETMAPTSADTVKTYLQDRGDALYRRSLYTYWKRSIPHPAMLAFGTPFREVCTLQRPRSNTPLQALNLMNDPTYVEAARFLAERMIREGGESTDSRLRHGFRLVLARPPSASHLAVLKRAFEKAQAHYRAEPAAAKALLTHGEKSADSSLDPIDHAAFTNVASTLLCLDEVVTKQ